MAVDSSGSKQADSKNVATSSGEVVFCSWGYGLQCHKTGARSDLLHSREDHLSQWDDVTKSTEFL